jgi:uncharacterized protein (DUF2267 family)
LQRGGATRLKKGGRRISTANHEKIMKFDEFVGQVQNRAKLGSTGEAVRAIQAVFQTLAERLDAGEAKDLAAQLPQELGFYLQTQEHRKRMSLDEFFRTISERETADLPDAVYHTRVVMEVLQEAVSLGEINDILAELPPEWATLFQGSQGDMRIPAGSR